MMYTHLPRLQLPTQLHILIQTRLASTTSQNHSGRNPYPYPSNSRPTPHQIFHLPRGASQQDIKARYYDLVRAHHPDSVHCRSLSPSERHSRFQAITTAYDILRGKPSHNHDPYSEEVQRRKRAYYSHYGHNRHAEYTHAGRHDWHASADDRWKDRIILIVGIVTLAAGVIPGLFFLPFGMERRNLSAAANLAQARNDARELGDERRHELRKRVKEIKSASSVEESCDKEI